jgi:hemerythrin-like metal-binding protein
MDAQHRRLIKLLAELSASVQRGESRSLAPAALAEVVRYAEQHLQREELLLRVRGYPGYAEHKAEHDAYRQKIASFQLCRERRNLGIRIANFLTDWWKSHILGSDRQYARFFQSMRAKP